MWEAREKEAVDNWKEVPVVNDEPGLSAPHGPTKVVTEQIRAKRSNAGKVHGLAEEVYRKNGKSRRSGEEEVNG